jgi:hypothetical protein
MPSEPKDFIRLSDESIERIRSLCDLVARKNRRNEQSRTMAVGIAEYAEHHGLVSRKQAEWLARNADFHSQPRPEELREVGIPSKEQERQASIFDDERYDDADDLISSLASIRKAIDAVISRLRA